MTAESAAGTDLVPAAPGSGRWRGLLRRAWPLTPALLMLAVLFVIPMLFILVFSFWDTQDFELVPAWNLDNYVRFFTVGTYIRTFIKTLVMAGLVTTVGIALAVPFAYFLVRYTTRRWQRAILVAVIVPFWTSYLLRVYAWTQILGERGAVNQALQMLGVIREPLQFFAYNDASVFIVLLYLYFPFAALALYSALEKFDFTQLYAAQDLGAPPWKGYRYILVPQIRAGLITAGIFVFIPIMGEFLAPTLVGGAEGGLIANLIVRFFKGAQYAEGAALAMVVAAFVIGVLVVLRKSLRVEDVVARG
jgi:spermidine/putrescine transport system permease protein